MSLKSCDESLIARVVSLVTDCADFLPIMWSSLGCSAESYATASMVFDLGTSQASLYVWNSASYATASMVFDLSTSQARLYVWNSFTPGFVAFSAPPGGILDDDILFRQVSWLNLRLELMFIYGSLPRPPDFQYVVVCGFLLPLLTMAIDSRIMFVGDVVFMLLQTFGSRSVLWKMEIWLEKCSHLHDMQWLNLSEVGLLFLIDLHVLSQDRRLLEFNSYATTQMQQKKVVIQIIVVIWFVLLLPWLYKGEFLSSSWMVINERHALSRCAIRQGEIWLSKTKSLAIFLHRDYDCDELWTYLAIRKVLREGELRLEDFKHFPSFGIDGCMPLELLIFEVFIKMMMPSLRWRKICSPICDMLNGLCTTKVLMQILKSNDEDVVQASFGKGFSALYYIKLLLDFYARFGTSTDIIFGSLPRPPEALYV